MIELFKDGDMMAIKTDAKDEQTFLYEMSGLFDQMIQDQTFNGTCIVNDEIKMECDWEFQFSFWLPQIVDICCKYRGYKSNVNEKRVLIAGAISPHNSDVIASNKAA